MSIHELAGRCAAYLAHQLEADRIKENRMAFGLELLLGEIVKLLCVITLSYALGILPEVLTITVTAGVLRLASGGEHCSAYYRCLIGGTLCFLLLGGIAHSLNSIMSREALMAVVVICFLYCVVMIIMMQFGTSNKLVLPMIIGMMEQAFTVTPWGYRFLHWVDNVLGAKKEDAQNGYFNR